MITVPVTALSMTRKKKDNYMRKTFIVIQRKNVSREQGP